MLVGAAAQMDPAAFSSVKRFIGRKRKAISRPEEHQVRSISFALKCFSLIHLARNAATHTCRHRAI